QLADLERVVRRDGACERERAGGRRQVVRVVVVLDDDRNAVQRAGQPAGAREQRVQRVGDGARRRVHGHDRVERGAALVERLDALEVQVHEPARGQTAVQERGVDLRDGGLFDLELPLPRALLGLGGGGGEGEGGEDGGGQQERARARGAAA